MSVHHSTNLRRISMISTSQDIKEQLTAAADYIDEMRKKSHSFDLSIFSDFGDRITAVEQQIKNCATRMDLEILEMQLSKKL